MRTMPLATAAPAEADGDGERAGTA